jgi:hypothetical protein
MTVHDEGRAAAEAGQPLTACPYPPLSADAATWQRGWARIAGAHPLDLTRARLARGQEAGIYDDPYRVDHRLLVEWPEPLRSVIDARLHTPNFDNPGFCRWCDAGVQVPGRERTRGGPRYRPYKSAAALARHEADCHRNPDATPYTVEGRGFTVDRHGQIWATFASPAALASMRQTMRALRDTGFL